MLRKKHELKMEDGTTFLVVGPSLWNRFQREGPTIEKDDTYKISLSIALEMKMIIDIGP